LIEDKFYIGDPKKEKLLYFFGRPFVHSLIHIYPFPLTLLLRGRLCFTGYNGVDEADERDIQ
jgi:hypothetical protein